jgi:hypothetical protein
VFITGQDLPGILLKRIEIRYRLADGQLQRED